MATVTVSWWLLWVVAGLALCGFWGAVWLAAAGLVRVRYWWRDRVTPLLEDNNGDEAGELLLPPERTWEQMTSHQLPVVGMSPAERRHWHKLERARKQRCRRVEMTHRAHYVAMGLEYPSGLMARVREAAQ